MERRRGTVLSRALVALTLLTAAVYGTLLAVYLWLSSDDDDHWSA